MLQFYLSEMFGRNTSVVRNQWRLLLSLGKRKEHNFEQAVLNSV